MTSSDVFFVGAKIGDKDFSDEFIKEGKWQLGWFGQESNENYRKMLAILEDITVGDTIVLKSTYTRSKGLPFEHDDKTISVMKLKKLGTVTQNVHDGHTLLVNWEPDFKPKEWYFYTNRKTIWKVSDTGEMDSAHKLIQFVKNDVTQDYKYFLDDEKVSSSNEDRLQFELKERKQDFLDFFSKDKWTSVIPKADWLSGYWDDEENYKKIKLVPIKQLLSKIKNLTPTENEYIRHIPDNLFSITDSEKFIRIADLINGIITKHRPELKTIIDSLNIIEGKSRHHWDYSNFKMRSWYQNYQKYLDRYDSEGNTAMLLQESRQLMNSKNMILRGAPGTGKTFLAKSMAADIVSEGATTDITNLSKEQQSQIGFVQFHPSYDYTDFVEGLRPLTRTDGSMGFELKDGTFTCFVKQARQNFELSRKSLQEQNIENDAWNVVDAYLDNVELLEDKLKIQSGNEFYFEVIDEENIQLAVPKNEISSKVVLKRQTLKDMVASEMEFTRSKDISNFFSNRKRRRQEDSYYFAVYNDIKEKQKNFKHETNELKVVEKPFVFIIDEINRGEISKIFGELFYSIDPGYRGMVGSVSTQYANLHDDPSEKFFVPENVYIIGTMNDIDRSVDSFDFAMRRRFRFVEVKASNQLKMLDELDDDTKEQAIQKLTNLNNAISATDELNDNYQIGPSYFLKLRQIGFDDLWDDYLQPLLKEYIRGMYNENDIMDRFQQAYNQVSDQDDDDTNSR